MFTTEGVEALRGVFASVEQRMIQFDRATTAASARGSRERVTGARKEVDQREKEYQKLVKDASKWEKQIAKDAERAAAEKVKIAETEESRKMKIRERSMQMAHRMLEQEVRDERRAAEQKASIQQRHETAMRRRFGRSMGSAVVSGLGGMAGSAASMIGMGMSIGGGFAVADAARKEMSFSRSVAQASNMSYIPGTTTRAQVAPSVIEGMAKGVQGLTNIDKEEVANAIKEYVGLSSDFEGLHGKTSSGKSGLEELAILSKASGTDFGMMMKSAASIKAANSGMTSEGLIGTMRTLIGAGKQGTLPLDQLAPYVGEIQATAGRFAGSGTTEGLTKNQGDLLGLVQIAGRATGGDTARAAMSIKDFSGDVLKQGLKHGLKAEDIWTDKSRTQLRSSGDILESVFKATKGDVSKELAIMGQRSMPLMDALNTTYLAGETKQKGSGVAAVRAEIDKFQNQSYSSGDTMAEFNAVMQTSGERVSGAFKHIEETVEGHVAPMLETFADALEKNKEPIDKFINSIAEAAEFMVNHPWISLFGAMEANILKSLAQAAIGQTIKEALAASVTGGGGAAAGVGGSVGKVLGTLAIAATAITIGVATIDILSQSSAKEQGAHAIAVANTGTLIGKLRAGTATREDLLHASEATTKLKGIIKGESGASFTRGLSGLSQLLGLGETEAGHQQEKEILTQVAALRELTTALRNFKPSSSADSGGGGREPVSITRDNRHNSPARGESGASPSRAGMR